MTDLMPALERLLFPHLALIFMAPSGSRETEYIEAVDIRKNGRPCNPRPLTEQEAHTLARQLRSLETEKKSGSTPDWLTYPELVPVTLLRVDVDQSAVFWYTEACQQPLFTTQSLGLPGGNLWFPPLVWKATPTSRSVFALTTDARPSLDTPLFHAPMFNVYSDGRVCLGTVGHPDVNKIRSVAQFMAAWETTFFGSYFSHANHAACTRSALIPLLHRLLDTGERFPVDELVPTAKSIRTLL